LQEMRRFFNRLDLLIVVICILLLFLVVGSVGKKGRENAKRMVCADNISQHLQGLTVFAGENEGRLPVMHGGYWPWDVDYSTTNVLLDSMGVDVQKPSAGQDIPVQDVFYCPSNIPQKKGRDLYWSYGVNPIGETGYRVMGYFILWPAPWNSSGVKTIYVDNPADTELVIDIVMSDARPNVWPSDDYPNGNFARILCGGMPTMGGFSDSSSHLITDREPAGGNIGFVDGHVEWRPFSQMERRWDPIGCPIAWW